MTMAEPQAFAAPALFPLTCPAEFLSYCLRPEAVVHLFM